MTPYQILSPEQLSKAEFIKEQRKRFEQCDSEKLQKKRIKFLSKFLSSNMELRVCELYPFENDNGSIHSKLNIPQYIPEFRYANTRSKLITETRAEIDKLPREDAIKIICEICSSLIRNKIHFVVFDAEGRSPHIIIYDFEELRELSPFHRMKAQLFFWRKICPFAIQYLDRGVWQDDHFVPLEFAPHWKTGKPFHVLFEYNPYPRETREQETKRRKEYAKKRLSGWNPEQEISFNEETREEKIERYKESAKGMDLAVGKLQHNNMKRCLEFYDLMDRTNPAFFDNLWSLKCRA